jgi:hypothetical protein
MDYSRIVLNLGELIINKLYLSLNLSKYLFETH